MNTDENGADAPRVSRMGGKRPGAGRPRKGEPPRLKIRRRNVDRFVSDLEAAAELEVRTQAAKKFLSQQHREMQARGELDGVGEKAVPEIPAYMLTRNGKLRKFAGAYACGRALLDDPTVPANVKAKLVADMLPYEKPRLAEKALGKKEERHQAAQTAGRSGEFDGLMEPPKGPRLVVNGS